MIRMNCIAFILIGTIFLSGWSGCLDFINKKITSGEGYGFKVGEDKRAAFARMKILFKKKEIAGVWEQYSFKKTLIPIPETFDGILSESDTWVIQNNPTWLGEGNTTAIYFDA